MITENSILKIKKEIAFRKLADGSATIVSPLTDKIISINPSAAEIWYMIDGFNTLKQITDCFSALHREDNGIPSEDEIKKDVFEIVVSFFKKDLIEIINN